MGYWWIIRGPILLVIFVSCRKKGCPSLWLSDAFSELTSVRSPLEDLPGQYSIAAEDGGRVSIAGAINMLCKLALSHHQSHSGQHPAILTAPPAGSEAESE